MFDGIWGHKIDIKISLSLNIFLQQLFKEKEEMKWSKKNKKKKESAWMWRINLKALRWLVNVDGS